MGLKSFAADLVNGVEPLRRVVSKKVINDYAYKTPPRPRAVSMAAPYVTWPGLTDKRWSSRHLPVCADDDAPAEPDIDAVAALFERKTFRPATDTSILFPFFAQWFVDSFLRTKWEASTPRQFRENESNHEIDLCQIYGLSEVQTKMLRAGEGGRLKSDIIDGQEWPSRLFETGPDGMPRIKAVYQRTPEADALHPATPGLYTPVNFQRVFDSWNPEEKENAFAVGLEHGNSTLGNGLMNTLFLREHNRTAGILAKAHPDWDDERIFQTARNVTTVVLLNIVISDYIVHIAPIEIHLEAEPGMAEQERWYRNNWMAVEFALLYRWHDLIPEALVVGDETRPASMWRRTNQWMMKTGLEAILKAASSQSAGRIGLGNTAHFLVAKPEDGGADVKRLSLSMSRACKLPSFNAYRRHYGMAPVKSFEALTGEAEMAARLKALYGSMDRLEWWVGLFAEGHGKSQMMGELLMTMVANDAFTQALTNPLLAKAVYNEGAFSKEGLEIIETTRTLAAVIAHNTGLKADEVGFKVRKAG